MLIIANAGGLLTPIGDPPLYLGFLKGVPFEWTFRLWAPRRRRSVRDGRRWCVRSSAISRSGVRGCALGVAPAPIAQRHLSAPRLAAAILRALDDAAMSTAARRLGEQVRAESGTAVAVDARWSGSRPDTGRRLGRRVGVSLQPRAGHGRFIGRCAGKPGRRCRRRASLKESRVRNPVSSRPPPVRPG
ncbi:sodium:proton antiporter [Actinoplanes aureus]|uniref:sodium:proton antiporter n=1 Tax=Actinoplanes aureus TaxID=2792083 RepID=UPI002814F25E|nr:sodium:proton antiporter [Actinoplanes aureus]